MLFRDSVIRKCNHVFVSLIFVGLSVLLAALVTFFIFQICGSSLSKSLASVKDQLDHPSSWPSVTVDSNEGAQPSPTDHTCHHYSCFDVYRCGRSHQRHITVYVYPMTRFVDEDGVEINPISREFLEIIEAVVESKYFTDNPKDACLFLPTIDTLNENNLRTDMIGLALAALPYWNGGVNHVLFNFLSGTAPHFIPRLGVPRGKAMVAGAGYSSHTYRQHFDVSLPVFNPVFQNRPVTNATLTQRPWYLVSSQVNIHREYYEELLAQVPKAKDQRELLLLHSCSESILERLQRKHEASFRTERKVEPFSKLRYRCRGDEVFLYPDILEQAQLCLVTRGGRLGQPVLHDALRSGCVPVLVADTLLLPFSEVLDWRVASVQFYEDDLPDLLMLLKRDLSVQRLQQLQQQVVWLHTRYFSSVKDVTLTALDILNERVFPIQRASVQHWNNKPWDSPPDNPLFLPLTAPKDEGFTAVILTYERLDSLLQVIHTLNLVPSCVRVLVVWNNQNTEPPRSLATTGSVPVEVMRTPQNRLSNRFFPFHELQTQAVLSLDDDITMMTADELEFGYQVWREFPDRIVGFPSRNVVWNNSTAKWKYDSEWTNEISMVLTGVAFYHKYWNYVYTTELFPHVKQWVDDHMNCEDIALNFLVANRTGKAPIKVTPRKKFKCSSCSAGDLSATEAHMLERSECVQYFTATFGTMPLNTVEFRADPLLYMDDFPEKLKLYKDIGSL